MPKTWRAMHTEWGDLGPASPSPTESSSGYVTWDLLSFWGNLGHPSREEGGVRSTLLQIIWGFYALYIIKNHNFRNFMKFNHMHLGTSGMHSKSIILYRDAIEDILDQFWEH